MHIGGMTFGYIGISSKKWLSHSASSPHLSSVINSDSIFYQAITDCFEDFHEIVVAPSVNMISAKKLLF